eukprot:7234632-Lingulodinium_polyedra.AAC.1
MQGEAVQEQWKAMATAFLNKEAPAKKCEKLHRLASYHWLCAVDHMLVAGLGVGLSAFTSHKASSDQEEEATAGPCRTLSLCVDQGSDGWRPSVVLLNKFPLNL